MVAFLNFIIWYNNYFIITKIQYENCTSTESHPLELALYTKSNVSKLAIDFGEVKNLN